ncbi:MAG: hypothetical protein JWM93_1352 [Frankiales bacterium]|nr:hypothetical protein [Frankiales bacterium]
MQATVSAFDPVNGSGTVLLDDGHEIAFGGEAFARSQLRSLRVGQRVRLRTSGDRSALTVDALTISTLTFPDERS